ncbi:MAG: flagellar export chaperone FlgN [Deltaproteobacteria bacterium]|nr:flagellar export chaperone FlgN [Deltaproteobacteria bacterium]
MNSIIQQEFTGLLEELKMELVALVDALREEREAIIDFDLQKIKDVYTLKNDKLIRIEALEKTRQLKLKELASSIGEPQLAKLESILEKIDDTAWVENIQNLTSCIRSIAQAAKEFNETQQLYLVHSLANIQSSLMLLDSLQGKGQFQCYDRQGGILNDSNSRVTLDRNV